MSENGEALKAASARFRRLIFGRRHKENTSRQKLAWTYYDNTPEVRFSAVWVGRAMSKATLFAARREPDGEIVPADENHPSVEFVASIAGGPSGQSQMLEAFGLHLVVAGEGWIVIVPQEGKDDEWFVLSVNEVESDGRVLKATIVIDGVETEVVVPPAGEDNDDPFAPLGIRIWSPHPAKHSRADSPVMSSMGILDELLLLNAAVASTAMSRLTGRGLLLVPQGMSLPDGDDLMDRLIDVGEMAYKEPGSAAANMPVVVEVPSNNTMKPELIKFGLEFDEIALKLREEAIRRWATAADTPAEVLLGMGTINHWGVWAIRDEAIEVGVEPRLATVCDGITNQGMWPDLQSKNVADWHDHLVWYETSSLRARTNPQTAIELGRDGIISHAAVRRETNFDDADAAPAPTPVEIALGLVEKQPALFVDPGLAELVRQIEGVVPATSTAPTDDADAAPVDLPVDETGAPPAGESTDETPALSTETLAAAVDGLIVRALERAGNKLRSSRPRSEHLTGLAASSYHTALPPTSAELKTLRLLDRAWDRVPELSIRHVVAEDCLVGILEDYTRALLLSGMEHTYDAALKIVEDATCLQPA